MAAEAPLEARTLGSNAEWLKAAATAVYRRADRQMIARMVVGSVMACLGLALCYGLLIHTSAGRRLDEAVYVGSIRGSWLRIRFVDSQLTNIDRATLKLAMVGLLGVGLVRRRPLLGVGAAFVAGGSVAAGHTLRYHVLDRAPFLSGPAWSTSFPSDHATVAISVAMALVMVLPPRWRGPVALMTGGAAAAVSTQVQVIGWHHLSDVLGAGFMSLAFASGAAAVLGLVVPGPKAARGSPWWALGLLGAGVVSTILAGITAIRGLLLSGGLSSVPVQSELSRAGLDLTVALIAVLLSVEVYLLGNADFDAVWTEWLRRIRGRDAEPSESTEISRDATSVLSWWINE